jgi:hypothetical protein
VGSLAFSGVGGCFCKIFFCGTVYDDRDVNDDDDRAVNDDEDDDIKVDDVSSGLPRRNVGIVGATDLLNDDILIT